MAASLVSSTDLIRFLPEIILTVVGTAMMVLDPLINKRDSKVFGNLAIAALIAGIAGAIYASLTPAPLSAACWWSTASRPSSAWL